MRCFPNDPLAQTLDDKTGSVVESHSMSSLGDGKNMNESPKQSPLSSLTKLSEYFHFCTSSENN